MSIRKFSIFLIVGFLWTFTVIYQSCTPENKNNTNALEDGQISITNNYVGDQTCSSCHTNEYNKWTESHHYHSMEEAKASTILGDFDNATFSYKGVDSRFFTVDDEYFIETEGPDGTNTTYKIAYTFGYEPLQQYLVKFPGGRLQTLHLCWDTNEKKWFNLFPDEKYLVGDWMHWTKGSMTWNSMCAECHSTDLKKNYQVKEDTFNTTFSSINVSCESCHGPGQRHVEWASTGKDYPIEKLKEHLYATTSATPIEQVENCAPCHARRAEVTKDYTHGDRFMDHYLPQTLLEGIYHADGQIDEEVYVYGSFIQSKMYQNGVKCTDCHDPHTLKLISIDNQLCTRCHDTNTYDSEKHHFHAVNTESSKCINCHMPGKYYMVNDYRRDHSFRVPRPDQSVLFETPNACNSCHTDKSNLWSAKAVERWYGPEREHHFSDDLVKGRFLDSTSVKSLIRLINDLSQPAIARATAVTYLGRLNDSESLDMVINSLQDPHAVVRVAALQSLTQYPVEQKRAATSLFTDDVRAVRVSASNTLAELENKDLTPTGRKNKEKADAEFLELLEAQADLPAGRMVSGQYYDRKGNLAKAKNDYLIAISMDPYLIPARENLALLYNKMGRNDSAIIQYKKVLEIEPENSRIHYYLGLIYGEIGDYANSIESLQKAVLYDEFNLRAYYNLGILLQTTNQRKEAESVYLDGLRRFPESIDLNYAIAILYLQENRTKEAKTFIDTLKRLDPDNPQFQKIFQL